MKKGKNGKTPREKNAGDWSVSELLASIIIPVFNKWDLTRVCLKSIAATTPLASIEVIIVDNASSDATLKAAPALGPQLFGSNFRYLRNEQNCNFAGACNQGAQLARGEFVIFLNNDTEALPNWFDPLLDDFSRFTHIAATGPVLLYPHDGPLGRLVQHLGVFVSPFKKFGHLYAGIPGQSPLAKERRFFQVISAACMAMPGKIFINAGGFCEEFINGFEDVDLCARLVKRGYRMTINPDSVLLHYESQTPGRKKHEAANGQLLRERSLNYLDIDWMSFLEKDHLRIEVVPWLWFQTGMDGQNKKLPDINKDNFRERLIEHPYWQHAWRAGLASISKVDLKNELYKIFFKLFRTPENALNFAEFIFNNQIAGERVLLKDLINYFAVTIQAPETYKSAAEAGAQRFAEIGVPAIARLFDQRKKEFPLFIQNNYIPLLSKLCAFLEHMGAFENKDKIEKYFVMPKRKLNEIYVQLNERLREAKELRQLF